MLVFSVEPKFEPRSSPLDFQTDLGISVASGVPGSVDVIVLRLRTTTLVEMGRDVDAPPLLGIRPPREFNKLNIRMKISVGAMPCVIGILSPHRSSLQVTNTHIDLHSNAPDNVLGGVVNRKENAVKKLHDQIEHAALDDDDDCSPTGFSLEVRA